MSHDKRDVASPLLFECAWEVANKVGGIYTVIKTKVPVTVAEYGDRYCLIGPLSYKTAPMEVDQEDPADPHIAAALDVMRAQGVKALYGRWLIEGAPHVLLFDTSSQYSKLDEWKGDLWNLAGIPSPPNDHETNEAIIFGYIVAWFLGEVCSFILFYFLQCYTYSRRSSTFLANLLLPLSAISTNGRQALPSLCAESGISISPLFSQRMLHFSADTFVQVLSTFTIIYSISTSIMKPESGVYITATV